MSLRLLLTKLALTSLLLAGLPADAALIPISSYHDDPFVAPAIVEQIEAGKLGPPMEQRAFSLLGPQVSISREDWIFRKDANGVFQKFAWNPWPDPLANEQGDFRFPNEARFPLFTPQRGADGKIVLRDGLQVWQPNQLQLGAVTAFEAANAAKEAGEAWAGYALPWGVDGRLNIEPRVFVDLNAFYSPSAREIFMGVVPYRLPGETAVKMFESATSWEMAAHESGHALHAVLKPNTYHDRGFTTWGESFGDQTEMWASLRKRDRRLKLLAETNGNLHRSNSLSSMVEAFAALVGKGTGIRDAFQELKVSDTSEEVHDRSQVLTGASYSVFLTIYDELRPSFGDDEALRQAGEIMGTFLIKAAEYAPENEMSLEDVAKAYLKVDKELFGSRYHARLTEEFLRRELFDANSEHEWQVHEDSRPYLYLSPQATDQDVEEMLRTYPDLLGAGAGFGLKLQSVTRDERFGRMIVRAQLTQGRYDEAPPLDNHGVLVFRADGMLADLHPPVSPYAGSEEAMRAQARETVRLRGLFLQARRTRLDQQGAPLAIVRQADGQLTLETHVLRGEGLNSYMEVFTLGNPRGKRRDLAIPPVPPDKQLLIPDDILN